MMTSVFFVVIFSELRAWIDDVNPDENILKVYPAH